MPSHTMPYHALMTHTHAYTVANTSGVRSSAEVGGTPSSNPEPDAHSISTKREQ